MILNQRKKNSILKLVNKTRELENKMIEISHEKEEFRKEQEKKADEKINEIVSQETVVKGKLNEKIHVRCLLME